MKPLHGLQEPEAQVSWVLHSPGFATCHGCVYPSSTCQARHLSLMPWAKLSCLNSTGAGHGLYIVPAVAAGSRTVYHKPISKGMIGKELAACLCGLAVTVAGPKEEGRRSHLEEGGVESGLG